MTGVMGSINKYNTWFNMHETKYILESYNNIFNHTCLRKTSDNPACFVLLLAILVVIFRSSFAQNTPL